MAGEYTITLQIKTNSSNMKDIEMAALCAIAQSSNIIAINALTIEKGWSE